MKIIREYYINRESKRISDAGLWAAMLDYSNDISDIEELVIAVRYLDDNLNIQTNFINISDLGPEGTKANNLIKKFSSICKNLNLKLNNLISITSDGASSFTGVLNGMVAQLQKILSQMQLIMSCWKLQQQWFSYVVIIITVLKDSKKLAKISLKLSLSNAPAERQFSAMKQIKSYTRNRLSQPMLNWLLATISRGVKHAAQWIAPTLDKVLHKVAGPVGMIHQGIGAALGAGSNLEGAVDRLVNKR
ncbi:MAG: hypothetical protein EZS28_038458 [Streblomastix strix]|uniref:Uncharacterized protein n=1 Tax=Streblomastix strix TaxID=222440 RepID=A0A5J4U8J4_9EUKA|nr:MAG: hypothetical protein EZS28_038458 [Streblomastix strix]